MLLLSSKEINIATFKVEEFKEKDLMQETGK
jgi:hypothetical protein